MANRVHSVGSAMSEGHGIMSTKAMSSAGTAIGRQAVYSHVCILLHR
ncbi:MAG: hypothetical protein HFH14_02285 [Lachnospiraceae bacterium]|nr:hypothetical protein [Lachnospiraceae bacterium]